MSKFRRCGASAGLSQIVRNIVSEKDLRSVGSDVPKVGILGPGVVLEEDGVIISSSGPAPALVSLRVSDELGGHAKLPNIGSFSNTDSPSASLLVTGQQVDMQAWSIFRFPSHFSSTTDSAVRLGTASTRANYIINILIQNNYKAKNKLCACYSCYSTAEY